ncbi:tetratricopeptide repeat protein 23 isoform X2 [Lampris incognitus]|uniref:tetratricopeptide repeat protein 23 isoform X2 n=1 Tax=Lampris incognitus TaxID=2546036 RepID=UPI0024B5EA21|nr:tetratricopeptide repeat protein 23 isoform X2 [Lampris incognitus]
MDATESSSESVRSNSRTTDASPLCDRLDAGSPPKAKFTGKDFIMTPPAEKLSHFQSRAQDLANNQQFDACIQDLVRCVALTKLAYGNEHLKLAQAHAKLANAYLQFKGFGMQAQGHTSLARQLLSLCSSISSRREDRLQFLTCLLGIYVTQGGAALLTGKLEEAESSYLEARRTLEELHQQSGINPEEKMKTELEISISLSRVFHKQGKLEEALGHCEKSLQLLESQDNPKQTCSVYRDMATIEQAQGRLQQAIAHLSKAHAIAMSQSLGGLDGAHISHSLALVLSTAAESHHNESATHYFEESLRAFENSTGPQDSVFLTVQDDFCRFLVLTGQPERCMQIQKSSLPVKKSAFGDLSAEVADTLQLIGGVEMSQGSIKRAHRTLKKSRPSMRRDGLTCNMPPPCQDPS